MNILFAGDIVIAKPENFKLSQSLFDFIKSHSIRCCNFESPICAKSEENSTNQKPLLKAGPSLFQTQKSVEILAKNNFNLCSLANNHIMDYGKQGLKNTIDAFLQHKIDFFGAGFSFETAYKPYIFTSDFEKIAIIAGSQAEFGVIKENKNHAGYAALQSAQIKKTIHALKTEHYFIILFSHAGLEDIDFPLPELQQLYREFVDFGVDIIIGNHPHIVQGQEIYNNKSIFYSLGNFYFDALNTENWTKQQIIEWNRSLVVSLNTVTHEIICKKVSLQNGILDFDESNEFAADFEQRSLVLIDSKKLLKKANSLATVLWEKYYKSYYDISNKQDITKLSFKRLIKLLIKKIFCKKKSFVFELNETMLLHNIQIEPHRWLVERYLYNKNCEQNKDLL